MTSIMSEHVRLAFRFLRVRLLDFAERPIPGFLVTRMAVDCADSRAGIGTSSIASDEWTAVTD